jgi:hypothetical protein
LIQYKQLYIKRQCTFTDLLKICHNVGFECVRGSRRSACARLLFDRNIKTPCTRLLVRSGNRSPDAEDQHRPITPYNLPDGWLGSTCCHILGNVQFGWSSAKRR